MTIHRIGLSATTAVCALALSACGGGGGGSPTPPPPAESTMLGISASNYQAVAQSAVSSALYLGGTSSLAGGDARLMSTAAATSRRALSAERLQSGQARPLATLNETVLCSEGGSLAISFNDANNNANFDNSDGITIDAQACKEDGMVMQGRMGLSLQALTGVYGSNTFNATLTMTLTGFSTTSGNDVLQGDGTLTMTIRQTGAGLGEVILATPRLALNGRIGGEIFSTTLVDTQLSLRSDMVGGAAHTSVSYNSGISSSQFGNKQVTVATPAPLVITGNNSYPSSGQMMVRGNASSVVRITALNATQARVELDAEGDGVYETQVVKTWAELE